MIGGGLCLTVCLACVPVQGNPHADLARLQAAVEAQPQSPDARFQLGRLLADPFADPRAIDELGQALKLGLQGDPAIEANYWIGWVAKWNGRDREAVAAFHRVQQMASPDDQRGGMAAAQLEAIRRSHQALAGAEAAEGRAWILLVVMGLGIIGMFWGGRRLARHRLPAAPAPNADIT